MSSVRDTGVTTDDQTNAEKRRELGEFVRGVSTARNWIEEGGEFPPEANRYHLYVAYNCPWCHRVLLGRAVAGLEDVITVDVVFPNRSNDSEPLGPNLWKFAPDGQIGKNGRQVSFPSCTADTVFGKKYVKEVYEECGITDQKSVPILIDKTSKRIVSNESAEILRMMGTVLRPLSSMKEVDLYPEEQQTTINEINDWVYKEIANGAYKAGFSSQQDAYEMAYTKYFAALDKVEGILSKTGAFLCGDNVTEADIRLFPVAFRHDPVYHNRMKLNKRFLWEYPSIWKWMGQMMRLNGMEQVSNAEYLQHCKQGYFGRTGSNTIPLGPEGYPECYLEPH